MLLLFLTKKHIESYKFLSPNNKMNTIYLNQPCYWWMKRKYLMKVKRRNHIITSECYTSKRKHISSTTICTALAQGCVHMLHEVKKENNILSSFIVTARSIILPLYLQLILLLQLKWLKLQLIFCSPLYGPLGLTAFGPK